MAEGSISTYRVIVLAKKPYGMTFETTMMLANLATKLIVTLGVFLVDIQMSVMIEVTA